MWERLECNYYNNKPRRCTLRAEICVGLSSMTRLKLLGKRRCCEVTLCFGAIFLGCWGPLKYCGATLVRSESAFVAPERSLLYHEFDTE